MPEEMVIFARTFDLLTWLLPVADKFPKAQRFVVTRRLMDAALDFQEALFHANALRREERLARLHEADAYLNTLRLYLRLSHQWKWLSAGQYEHVSRMIEEIGRLLGGWLRQTGASAQTISKESVAIGGDER
ncbi:MAG: diversity-generating retroelement protein Avd [Candidatus Poribacteria bacterium]|nr:diversity-generating retroelement protein Avd [Candidatus Poribacteria bacterium]